jgi:hypothetical protein
VITTEGIQCSRCRLESGLDNKECSQADKNPDDERARLSAPDMQDLQGVTSVRGQKKLSARLLSNLKGSQIGRAREVFARKNAKIWHQPETGNRDTYRGPEQRTSTMFRSQPSNSVPITRQTVNIPIKIGLYCIIPAMKIAEGAIGRRY